MAPLLIAAAAGTTYQIGKGIIQNSKANKMERSTVRPDYEVQQPYLDNQDIAEHYASTGMSDYGRQVYQQGAERGLSSAQDAIIRSGASVNSVGQLYSAYNDGISRMGMYDEQLRTNNLNRYMQRNDITAEQLDKKWQIDKWAPYMDRVQAIATLRNQASKNINNGINTMISGVTNQYTSNMYKKETNDIFGGSGSNSNGGDDIPYPQPPRRMERIQPTGYDLRPGMIPSNAIDNVRAKYPGLTGYTY